MSPIKDLLENRNKRKKLIKILIIALFFICVFVTVLTFYTIHKGVKEITVIAKNRYNEDSVNSLVEFIRSEENYYKDRNKAIWALGQLADKKAILFLESIRNESDEKERGDLSKELSQYEINKALRWCREGNLTSWMYENRDGW